MLKTSHLAVAGATALLVASAREVFDSVPLGASISYSDGTPEPPARFKNKHRAWLNRNSFGTLISKSDRYSEDQFTLHEGAFGTERTIVMVVNKTYGVSSDLKFTVTSVPQPGQVLIVTRSDYTGEQLRHIANNRAAAEAWLAGHGYSDAVFWEIQADGTHVETSPTPLAA